MSVKRYIINKGGGKIGIMTGDTSNLGFMKALEGKAYYEAPEGPLVKEDPRGIFRSCYEMSEGKICINMEKAKEGYLQFLKNRREVKFAQLDLEQIRALGVLDFDKVKEIEESKQALRDMPELIDWDSINNFYDLVHLYPPILQ